MPDCLAVKLDRRGLSCGVSLVLDLEVSGVADFAEVPVPSSIGDGRRSVRQVAKCRPVVGVPAGVSCRCVRHQKDPIALVGLFDLEKCAIAADLVRYRSLLYAASSGLFRAKRIPVVGSVTPVFCVKAPILTHTMLSHGTTSVGLPVVSTSGTWTRIQSRRWEAEAFSRKAGR